MGKANYSVPLLVRQLVYVEMELKLLQLDMGSADSHRRSEFHTRLSAIMERQREVSQAFETLAGGTRSRADMASGDNDNDLSCGSRQ